MAMIVTKHLRLYGHVQGVFFRESMTQKALQLGIAGWVRNCSDGTVEAMVQGEDKTVADMIAWAKVGPRLARVEKILIEDGSGNYDRFSLYATT